MPARNTPAPPSPDASPAAPLVAPLLSPRAARPTAPLAAMGAPTRRGLAGAALAAGALAALPRPARAQAPVIRIGVLNDQSGPYRDNTGAGSVECARQAAMEWAANGGDSGFRVEVLSADHQNKPDIGAALARGWLDRDGVDVIMDVPTSSVALAVAGVVRERNKVYLNSGGGTADLTGVQCTPNTVHWTYDTYMLARSTATQLVKRGGDKWFFITADYVFGQQLERDAARFVKEAGGTVVGRAAYPFPETTDFSSYLLQAQAAGANVIGFASAGNDTVNGVKQAHEFGLGATHEDGGAAGAPHGCGRHRAGAGAGAVPDRHVLLGHERGHAGVHEAGGGPDAGPAPAQHDPGGAATPARCTT